MRTRSRVLAAFAGLIVSPFLFTSLTAYAQAPAGPNRPAPVPEDYVITPFGYFHPSCVVHLKQGETLLEKGLVIQHADGRLTSVPACEYPHYTARGEIMAAGAMDAPTISHSWIVSESATTSTSYGEITANWTVPSAPLSYDGQTIFFFPGLEDINDVVSIIQPVLGYNADFSKAWGIASWNCCPSGTADESSPVKVNVGDIIEGTVKSTCAAGTLSCTKWNITTEDAYTGGTTTLSNTPSEGQTFNWAFGGVLEVYSVAQCSDYPPNDYISFYPALYNDSFGLISSPSWSLTDWASGLTPQCQYGGSASSGVITLDFGNAGGPPWNFSASLPSNSHCPPSAGNFTFAVNQEYNENSLSWLDSLSLTELAVQISFSWNLSDSKGQFASGSESSAGNGGFSATRAPVGTPSLYLSGYLIQEDGCYDQFSETVTGTH
jgi:hypothetical protein